MSKHTIDLDMVESTFNKVVATNDDLKIAEFAKRMIPLLVKDSKQKDKQIQNTL